MPFFSAALSRIKPSPTNFASDRARRLKAEGRDIVPVSSGEPDFATPDNIREAANAAIAPILVNEFESESASSKCVMNPGSV